MAAVEAGTGLLADMRIFVCQRVPDSVPEPVRRQLDRDGLVLFDNPSALLICVFKRDNALCHPDPNANAPRQFACQQGCGNAIRIDNHAQLLRDRAAELECRANLAPGPLGDRFHLSASRLRALADGHDATARTTEELE